MSFDDVLHKIEHLLEHRQIAWENQLLRSQVDRQWDFDNLVGRAWISYWPPPSWGLMPGGSAASAR